MIVRNTDENYEKFLQELVSSQEWQSPFHTKSALNYYKERPLNDGKLITDKSYILVWENEPVAAFYGSLVKDNNQKDLIACEVPCISIAKSKKISANAIKEFLREFDHICEEVNGVIKYRDYLIENSLSDLTRHLLQKSAFAVPKFNRIINLKQDVVDIKKDMRKSYKHCVNSGIRELKPQVLDASNLTWDEMNNFRELHIREAGRVTRSENSWKRQLEMVFAGEAFVVFGHIQDELVTGGLFIHSSTNCYYGVSASKRDLFKKPLFHALLWTAILHAKKNGCHWFEVGEQLFPNHPLDPQPSKKELGISEFKAGFGGIARLNLDIELTIRRGDE
jgi:hypothetical protein